MQLGLYFFGCQNGAPTFLPRDCVAAFRMCPALSTPRTGIIVPFSPFLTPLHIAPSDRFTCTHAHKHKFYAAHRSSAGLSPSASASGGSAFTGRGGGGGGRGNAPLRGQASASARFSQRSEVGAEGRGGRGAPRGARAGVVGVDADEAGYSMEMTFQQQPQQAQRRPRSQSPPLERDLGRESDGVP